MKGLTFGGAPAVRIGDMDTASGPLVSDPSLEADRPIQLGGSVLGAARHVCAFFTSRDDHYQRLPPFIEEGSNRARWPFTSLIPNERLRSTCSSRRPGSMM